MVRPLNSGGSPSRQVCGRDETSAAAEEGGTTPNDCSNLGKRGGRSGSSHAGDFQPAGKTEKDPVEPTKEYTNQEKKEQAMEERGRGDALGGTGWRNQAENLDEDRFAPIRSLLFGDDSDGDDYNCQEPDNWNKRFQEALDLPEDDEDCCYRKWQRLTTVNRDFVAAAVTYGKTIISEYFLDPSEKSIKTGQLGGVCGGKKFVWRGIMFKLADGSSGPYCGNDEAAAKGAGHDLRGATHYFGTRIRGLHFALQCVIDFKGFRMTAQAYLPVNSSTLRYGTADAARTVHNEDSELEEKIIEAAEKLNLRAHKVKDKVMHSACDIEGHLGSDNRHYLLDFARSFPPESPLRAEHLSNILNDGTPVEVVHPSGAEYGGLGPGSRGRGRGRGRGLSRDLVPGLGRGSFQGAYSGSGDAGGTKKTGVICQTTVPPDVETLTKWDIQYEVRLDDTGEMVKLRGTQVKERWRSIFWRMLRPEFVKGESEIAAGVSLFLQQEQEQSETAQVDSSGRGLFGNVQESFRKAMRRPNRLHLMLDSHISEASNEEDDASVTGRVQRTTLSPRWSIQEEDHGGYTGMESDEEDEEPGTAEPSPPDPQEDFTGWRDKRAKGDEGKGADGGGDDPGTRRKAVATDRESGGGNGKGNDCSGGGGGGGGGGRSSSVERAEATSPSDSDERGHGDGGGDNREKLDADAPAEEKDADIVGSGRIDGDRQQQQQLQSESPPSTQKPPRTPNQWGKVGKGSGRGLPPVSPVSAASSGALAILTPVHGRSSMDSRGELRRSRPGAGAPLAGHQLFEDDVAEIGGAYEVYMDYDDHRQVEKGIPTGSTRSTGSYRAGSSLSRGNNSSSSNGLSFINGSLRGSMRGRQGDCAASARSGTYETMDASSNSLRKLGSIFGGSDVNIGSAAGGASGRAGPRGLLMEGNGSSGNLSFKFYDDEVTPEAKREIMKRQARRRQEKLAQRGSAGSCTAGQWNFTALSPDALSIFCKMDRERSCRNQEVHDATTAMIEQVLPMVADTLMTLPQAVLESLDLSIELHRYGVNIRHLGQLRSKIPPDDQGQNSFLRDMILIEMVARTLKNVLRSFQRKWMKAERSTSEQGMCRLVVEFLNLVTGVHVNSTRFWQEQVMVGLLQRFGLIALTDFERMNIVQCTLRKPHILKTCLVKLTEMQGLVLKPVTVNQFEMDSDPFNFGFVVSDIQEIRPIVTYMHILDYGGGVLLSMEAQRMRDSGEADSRTIQRLDWNAKKHFMTACQSHPGEKRTREALLYYSNSLGVDEFETPEADAAEGADVPSEPEPSRFVFEQGEQEDMWISHAPSATPPIVPDKKGFFRRLLAGLGGSSCTSRQCACVTPKPVDGPLRKSSVSVSVTNRSSTNGAGHHHHYSTVTSVPTDLDPNSIHDRNFVAALGPMPGHVPGEVPSVSSDPMQSAGFGGFS